MEQTIWLGFCIKSIANTKFYFILPCITDIYYKKNELQKIKIGEYERFSEISIYKF